MKFFWKTIGDAEYLKDFTSIKKDDTHMYYSKIILLPIFIFWIVITLYFPIMLHQKRNKVFIKDFPPHSITRTKHRPNDEEYASGSNSEITALNNQEDEMSR